MTIRKMHSIQNVGDYIFATVEVVSSFWRVKRVCIFKPKYSSWWRDLNTGKFMHGLECEQFYDAHLAKAVLHAEQTTIKGAAHG